jgi:hypothetical protein
VTLLAAGITRLLGLVSRQWAVAGAMVVLAAAEAVGVGLVAAIASQVTSTATVVAHGAAVGGLAIASKMAQSIASIALAIRNVAITSDMTTTTTPSRGREREKNKHFFFFKKSVPNKNTRSMREQKKTNKQNLAFFHFTYGKRRPVS